MDISDGLYCDCNKLLSLNGLYLKEIVEIKPEVGDSGEEYEMLIAFDEKNLKKIEDISKTTKHLLQFLLKVLKEASYTLVRDSILFK